MLWKPRPGENTKNNSRLKSWTKTRRITGRILVATGGSHWSERLLWPSVPSNQRTNTGVNGLTYNILCEISQYGMSLAITYSVGQLCHSWWSRYSGSKVYGSVLYGLRHDRIKGPVMTPRDHQCPHRTLQKGQPYGQNSKIQDHDLPARVNFHMDSWGGVHLEYHRIGGYFPGTSLATSCSRIGLCNHFSRVHWGGSILIPKEHLTQFPYCECCNQQVTPWLLNNLHYNT